MNKNLLNLGPQHPSAHRVLRLLCELEGKIVTNISPEIRLLHREAEKLCKYRSFEHNGPYFDRFNYIAALSREKAYSLAVEKLLINDFSNISQFFSIQNLYLQLSLVKLNKILNHSLAITAQMMNIGTITPFL